jgi:hypothetical protein
LDFNASEQIEPYFCSLALYDLRLKKKLSENFNFEINDDTLLNELDYPRNGNISKESQTRRGLFTLSENLKSVALILKIKQLLRPIEQEKILNVYQKSKGVCIDLFRMKYFEDIFLKKEENFVRREIF